VDGIVSLLDNDHYQLIEELWAELKREFSVDGVSITPFPHFSYQIAQKYNVDKTKLVLERIAANITTFKVRTSGLGIFSGTSPVLYIPVVRSLELTQLHQELWEQISSTSFGAVEHYHPKQWMPHITIGFGDISKENLSQIIPFLAERDFNWEITVNNLAFIHDTGTKQELKSRFDIKNEPISGESSKVGLYWHPVTDDVVEGLHQIQERIRQESKGHVFEDSTEIIHQMREERTRQLMERMKRNQENYFIPE
jgi:2'-5' RNA ligase